MGKVLLAERRKVFKFVPTKQFPDSHAPIFFPSPPVISSLVLRASHCGHFHRRKLFLPGITSARYMRCASLEQLTRGIISRSAAFASFMSRKYPEETKYRIKQPGSWQAYDVPSADSVGGARSNFV